MSACVGECVLSFTAFPGFDAFLVLTAIVIVLSVFLTNKDVYIQSGPKKTDTPVLILR